MFYKFYPKIFYITLFAFNFLVQVSYSMTEDFKNKSVPLDVVIALDKGDDYKYFEAGMTAAVAMNIARAIKDDIPFICNSHLLYIVKNSEIYNPQFKLLESGSWNLYENLDKDFVIGIPKKNLTNLPDVSYIGINKDNIKLILQSKIEEFLQETSKSLPK